MRAGCRTATVLFSDLVGSTDLLSRLGDAAFGEVRRSHFAALADVVARYRGEEVKTLGDGVLAVFDAAADAVAGAVAIQRAVDRQSRSARAPLAVRVGLALGDVNVEDDDVFGSPVVEAARLVAMSGPGEILATSVVSVVAGGQCESLFTEIGSVELKGLPKPVPVCRVEWEALEPAIPMPALLTDMGRIFVGRDAELGLLRQLWKEAAVGERRVALLSGEPGVGKTRLAAELAGLVHSEGGIVLAGRCDEDLGVPYQPFVEALRHLVDHTDDCDLPGHLGRYAGELERLLPGLRQRLLDAPPLLCSDPATERYRLFDAVTGWLAATAHEPVLLVLDDLQWAAKPTLLLLRHVVRSPEPMRLLVVATYRDTELHHDHPLVGLLADLRRQTGIERLSVSGFDQAAVADFMAEAAGHDMDDDGLALARAIHIETEGNPFFVREILRHLTETGAVVQRDGRWVTSLAVDEVGIPEGVREVVGRRVSRLSSDANRVLRVAAVVGTEFELPVVQRAGGVDDDAIFSAVEEAITARLVVETAGPAPRHRFTHALVRETLYDQLSGARRVALHRRVAEVIEELHAGGLDDHLPALALHWARASAPTAETDRAVDYATRAGNRALTQLAHDEAVTYYRQALELLDAARGLPEDARRTELLIALGDAQRRAGDPAHRQTLLDAARAAYDRGDGEALTRAVLANARTSLYSAALAVDADRVASLEHALDAVGPDDTILRARLLATLGVELTFAGQRDRRFRLSAEALRIARRLRDADTLAHVLMARVPTIWEPSTLAERLAHTSELLTVAEQLVDPATAMRAHWLRFRMTMEAGAVDEADHHLDLAERLATELGQPTLIWMGRWSRGGRLLMAGRIEEAERLFQNAFEIGQRSGEPDAAIYFAFQQFQVRFEQGRLDEVAASFADIYARHRVPMVGAFLARLHCELDQFDDARRVLDSVAAASFVDVPLNSAWLVTLLASAAVVAEVNDTSRAQAAHDLLARYPDQFSIGGGFSIGSTSHYLGMLATTLGRFGEAEGRFAAAAEAHTRIGAPTWLARTRLEWARMLLTRREPGDAKRAAELLGQALATAREATLTNVEQRAVALLSRCS